MKTIKSCLCRGLLLASLLLPCITYAETITIAGTGDSQHLLRKLADVFQQARPGDEVLVPNSVGSGGGLKLLAAGRTELARTARPLKPKEQAEGLTQKIFAYSPVVFVANIPHNCVKNIDQSEFLDILQGRINNWNQLGGCPENKIYVANREEGDSSKAVLEKHIPALNNLKNPVGRTIYSTPEAYDTLNRYPFSFGYLPKSQVLDDNLTILSFNGTEPSDKNIRNGTYKLNVPLAVVWRNEPNGLTREFLDFLFSAKSRELMRKLKVVPAF